MRVRNTIESNKKGIKLQYSYGKTRKRSVSKIYNASFLIGFREGILPKCRYERALQVKEIKFHLTGGPEKLWSLK